MIRTYEELSSLKTFDERFRYLQLNGQVSAETFGFDRYLNQKFYTSKEWRRLRDRIIIRDNGCDLGLDGYDVPKGIVVHHMNPISKNDIFDLTEYLLNPNYLICVSDRTHKAIHYGDISLIEIAPTERFQNDTCPWRK